MPLDQQTQWEAIKRRSFLKVNANVPKDSTRYSPFVVINGLPFELPINVKDGDREKIVSFLDSDSTKQIAVLGKPSEEWIFCKPFTGVIIIAVDKDTEKKLFKLKL